MSTVTIPALTDATFAAKMDELIDKFGRHTLTITALSNDDVPITEQTIKIYNTFTGALYATLVYNSPTSLTIDLPDGFNYQIVPICTLPDHYCEDKPSGMITSDTTVTLTYKTLGTLSTFPGLKAVLSAGLGSYIRMGTEVSYTDAYLGDIVYECADYNADDQVMTLLMKYCIQQQFDAPEALYYASEELAAGAYSFISGSSTYYFTLTQNVPAGGQIRATTTAFTVHPTKGGDATTESGTVSTTEISGAVSLGTTGQGALNHMDRVNYGSNDYGESGLRQWLNSSGLNWWEPKTMFDRPHGSVAQRGFMSGIPSEVLDCIDTVDVLCRSQNVYAAPDSSHGKDANYTCHDKFFLASEKEIFGSASIDNNGKIYNLYVGAVDVDRIKYNHTNHSSASIWWLRAPVSNAGNERGVGTSGAVGSRGANGTNGVAAACKVSASAIS